MSKTNCSVCGLPKQACLHQKEFEHDLKDLYVTRFFWFVMGFLCCALFVIIILNLVYEKYI